MLLKEEEEEENEEEEKKEKVEEERDLILSTKLKILPDTLQRTFASPALEHLLSTFH